MFFRGNVLSTLATALLLIFGLCAAAQTVAPVLVPYNMTAIAGNTQSSVAGYGGEGVPGLSATLNGPHTLAVDSVGNVYIADQANALIREWNPRTNLIKTVAGVPPSKCTGTTCTTFNSGCSDGVPAYGNPVGSNMQGLVVDGFGNVYFSDYNFQGVWVIYRGGDQVANFIGLVDKETVNANPPVKPGYIYHIAGTAVPKTGGGCTGTAGTTDNVLATSATFHDPLQMGIDAAGNLYVQDYGNNIVRVINTQATPQTLLGVTVQPGYVRAVVGCNPTITVACPSSVPPWGSPATEALYNVQTGMTTDQYGNVYQVNGKGATGSIYGGVAYAGGAALAHLIDLESGLTPTVGGWYEVIDSITSTYCTGYSNPPTCTTSAPLEPAVPANGANNIALRPVSIAVDPLGNLYMLDSHWQTIYRVDVNSQMASRLMPGAGNSGLVAPAGTNAVPAYCSGTSGAQTSDAYGDGCTVQQSKMSSSGTGYVTFDAAGNLYFSDTGDNIVRKISLGTQFASTNLGASLTQTLQMHFDASNLPTANNATAFKILGATTEFAVSSVTCANYTIRDNSIECYVTLAFTPQAVGIRVATLQTSTPGGTYDFALSGLGGGPELAIDGGAPSTFAVSGVGAATAVAIDAQGNVYTADPTNNRITMTPPGGGTTTTVGSGFKSPQGVALDAAGNVYVSDTDNNRIVKIAAVSATQTVLSTSLNSSTGLKNPQGIAVDTLGNVYVADTGNARVVEISPFGELAPVPMLDFSGSQAFATPVAVALDTAGNLYVADSGNGNGIIKIAAGGGDLQVPTGGTAIASPTSLISFGTAPIAQPTGIAVDAAGDLYVTDAGSNAVLELPAGTGPGSDPITLGFTGLSSPGGLALDSANNLYVADTGNNRIAYMNRSQVTVDFGTVAQFQPASTVVLSASNIGTSPLTPSSPFAVLTGATTADYSETDSCGAGNFPLGTLTGGLHCSLTVGFQPLVNGPLTASVSAQGGAANISLIGTGENPLASITMAVTSPSTGPVADSPATITLTATAPHSPQPPSGTVTFNYTINGAAQTPVTENLTVSGNSSTATFALPTLLHGRTYVIDAVYNGDASTSPTNAAPFTIAIPGIPVTVVANSVSYTYGGAVPALTGTVSGIAPADQAGITVTFTSKATPSTPVGTYPIVAVLTGGNAVTYTPQPAVTPSGTPAIVTENPAPLTVMAPTVTEPYGYPDVSYGPPVTVTTGLVNGDSPVYTFTPARSSLQPVGTYKIVPTLSILSKGSTYDKINNYTVTITDGSLVVTKATPVITVTQAATAVLPTNLSGAKITITVSPQPLYYGTTSGTLTMTDTFTPITSSGNGTPVTNTPITLTLSPTVVSGYGNVPVGVATYTPTSATLGTHVYTFSYSGDSNFNVIDTTTAPTSLIIDQADFTVTSTTSPILIVPGIVPGGDPTQPNEQAATPEQAAVFVAPILGSTETVTLTCAVPASYITCTLSPATLTLAGKTLTSTVSVSTPATLPTNYKASVEGTARNIAFALLPTGLLTLLPLFRRRRRLSQIALTLAAFGLLVLGTGCGNNLVQFYTPVPAGPTSVVVTGTSGSFTRSFTIPINIQ
jgi:sugar lactone lactonase YvrE